VTGWKELGWIEVDSACVAFCDASIGSQRLPPDPRSLGEAGASLPEYEGRLVYCPTREDCPLPIEVPSGSTGPSTIARMCFTTDVDEIEGSWRNVGSLELPDGRCLALDPHCEGPEYRFLFGLAPGSYRAQVFDFVNADTGADAIRDVLAVRIVIDDGSSSNRLQ